VKHLLNGIYLLSGRGASFKVGALPETMELTGAELSAHWQWAPIRAWLPSGGEMWSGSGATRGVRRPMRDPLRPGIGRKPPTGCRKIPSAPASGEAPRCCTPERPRGRPHCPRCSSPTEFSGATTGPRSLYPQASAASPPRDPVLSTGKPQRRHHGTPFALPASLSGATPPPGSAGCSR
jgi:hypothetical protein